MSPSAPPNAAVIARAFGVLGALEVPLGLGLLRLSTEGRPSEAEAVALIHHALERGVRVLDTADSYGLNDRDLHYGERLARAAIATFAGARDEVRVITKAGLARPKGKWVPNGSRAHLRRMVEESLAALGVERLFLLLLHVNDPRTPYEESLAALAELQREGKLEHVGLCNVSIAEVRQAERHFPVAAVQNELSVVDRGSANDGVVELARRLGIPFLAHRPLGGHAKTAGLLKNRALKPLATRHAISPHEAALAALLDLGGPVLPLFGATRRESVESSLRALQVTLDDADREALASRISFAPSAQALADVAPPLAPHELATLAARHALVAGVGPGDTPEVVLVMGIQGAGKSAEVERYVASGYERLNRDTLGGTLEGLVPRLGELLAAGRTRVVLDNTYPTRVSRHPVIRAAHAHGVPVRCRHLATPIHEAQQNVALRVLERHGRLLGPDDLKQLAKEDPNLPPPQALARWAACFEPPHVDEGFGVVEEIPFVRRVDPSFTGKGLLLDVDGTLRKTLSGERFPRSPDDLELLPGRREALQRWLDDGYSLFFVSNQSGIASETVTREAVDAAFARTIELLGLPVREVAYCPHPAFPVGCFCRKPLPGLGVSLVRRHRLSREHLVMVGDLSTDEEFARAIGARYVTAAELFGG